MEKFGKFMAIVLVMTISPIIAGFTLSKLWFWFVVPIFQVPQLRVVEAIGIIFLINFIMARRDKNATLDTFWDELGVGIIFTIGTCAFSLLFGWIVTLFL